MTDYMKEIEDAVGALETQKVIDVLGRALDSNAEPMDVLSALRKGAKEVGRRYEEGEYFISELVVAGEIMKRALQILKPVLKTKQVKEQMHIVLGSAFGDLHDIGKEIVKSLLISGGFEVHDLGVDVSPAMFVEELQKTNAKVIGISALLSTTTSAGADVVKELDKKGLRGRAKVILGGAAVREWMVDKFGVDGAVNDAVKGVELIQSWLG